MKICLWWLELKNVTATEKYIYFLFFYICSESTSSLLSITLPFIEVFMCFSLPNGLNFQAGKLPLWNVSSDILQSRNGLAFASCIFICIFSLTGFAERNYLLEVLLSFMPSPLLFQSKSRQSQSAQRKLLHVLGVPWVSFTSSGTWEI